MTTFQVRSLGKIMFRIYGGVCPSSCPSFSNRRPGSSRGEGRTCPRADCDVPQDHPGCSTGDNQVGRLISSVGGIDGPVQVTVVIIPLERDVRGVCDRDTLKRLKCIIGYISGEQRRKQGTLFQIRKHRTFRIWRQQQLDVVIDVHTSSRFTEPLICVRGYLTKPLWPTTAVCNTGYLLISSKRELGRLITLTAQGVATTLEK